MALDRESWARLRWAWPFGVAVAAAACATPAVPAPPAKASADAPADAAAAELAASGDADLGDTASPAADAATIDSADVIAPPKPCLSASQCPATSNLCRLPTCNKGVCTVAPAPDGSQCGAPSCGSSTCQAGECVTKLWYSEHAFDDIPVNQVNGGCLGGGGSLLVGWGKVAGQAGKAAWIGRLPMKTASSAGQPSSTLWQGGYAAELQACLSGDAVGWQQTGDGAERDSVWLQWYDGVVINALSLPAAGDDELRAISDCPACDLDRGAAGEVTQKATGLDARLVLRNYYEGTSKPTDLTYPAPGDQYVRGLAGADYGSPGRWVLCGFQSVGGAPADGWVMATGPGGAPIWTTTVGDNYVQRLQACAVTADAVVAVGVTFTPYGNTEVLGRPWLVKLNLADGKVIWQRAQAAQWANGGELLALTRGPGVQTWWAAGYERSGGIEWPQWQRFDADGWLQAWGTAPKTGRAVYIERNMAYLQNDWLQIGIRRDNPLRSELAVRNGAGGTQCACTKETICPPAKACQLTQCGESCSKAWAGNPCPLAGDTTATGICSADGSCLAP